MYHHPSENRGSVISLVELKWEKYEEWARSMYNSLQAKKKLGFINGTLKKSAEDSSEMEDWWRVNSMLVDWIIQHGRAIFETHHRVYGECEGLVGGASQTFFYREWA